MRHLDEIKRINECSDPDDDWADSARPITPEERKAYGKSWKKETLEDVRKLGPFAELFAPPRILEPPPMYKYVKETFNVPATWRDHFKIHARGHAAVYWPDWAYGIVCFLFKNIKSTRIPVTYEIHAAPKITGRRGSK
jgi:hypothetical protein